MTTNHIDLIRELREYANDDDWKGRIHLRDASNLMARAADALEAMQAKPTIDEAYVTELKRVWRDMPSAAPAPVADDALPEPALFGGAIMTEDGKYCGTHNGYTADQMRAAIAREREKLRLLAEEMEYRGNSVAFIYQKMIAYRNAVDEAWDALRAASLHPDGFTRLCDVLRALCAELEALRQQLAEAAQDTERLNSRTIMTTERDEFGEQYTRITVGIDLRAAIDAAIAAGAQK